MSFSLTSVANKVAAEVNAVIVAEQAASKTLTDAISLAANLMEGVETAYSGAENAGETKLAAVTAGVEAGLALVPTDAAAIKGDLTSFVSAAKSVYNVLKATPTPTTPTTATTTAA